MRPGTAGTEKTLSNEKSSLPVAAENGFGPRRGYLKSKLFIILIKQEIHLLILIEFI